MPVGFASGPSVAARAATAYNAKQPRKRRSNSGMFLAIAALIGVALLSYILVPWASILAWASQEQRAFQNAMAGYLRAIRGGDNFAILALCSATAAYGFVHALGPGHGKVLLGGAALASSVTMRRMVTLTLISSLG